MLDQLALFHETNDFHGEAYEAFEWVKRYRDPGSHLLSLRFVPKQKFVPLQAADALAYEAFRRLKNGAGPARRALDAIHPDGDRLTLRLYDKRNMDFLISTLERVRVENDQGASQQGSVS